MDISDIKLFSVIFNPTAGKGNALKKLPIIKKYLEENNLNYEIHTTERIGHAISLAEDLCGNPDTVVIAAGGDGTCNEVKYDVFL